MDMVSFMQNLNSHQEPIPNLPLFPTHFPVLVGASPSTAVALQAAGGSFPCRGRCLDTGVPGPALGGEREQLRVAGPLGRGPSQAVRQWRGRTQQSAHLPAGSGVGVAPRPRGLPAPPCGLLCGSPRELRSSTAPPLSPRGSRVCASEADRLFLQLPVSQAQTQLRPRQGCELSAPRLTSRTCRAPWRRQSVSSGHVSGGQVQRPQTCAPEPGGPGLSAARPPAQVSAAALRPRLGTGGAAFPSLSQKSPGAAPWCGERVGPAHTFQSPFLQVLRGWPQRNHPLQKTPLPKEAGGNDLSKAVL